MNTEPIIDYRRWCDAWFLCFLRQIPRSYNSTFPPSSQCEKSYWLLHVQQLNVCFLMKYHKIFIFSFNLSHDCLTTTPAWHYSCCLHVVVDVVIVTKRTRPHWESMITVTTAYIVVRNAWHGYYGDFTYWATISTTCLNDLARGAVRMTKSWRQQWCQNFNSLHDSNTH